MAGNRTSQCRGDQEVKAKRIVKLLEQTRERLGSATELATIGFQSHGDLSWTTHGRIKSRALQRATNLFDPLATIRRFGSVAPHCHYTQWQGACQLTTTADV